MSRKRKVFTFAGIGCGFLIVLFAGGLYELSRMADGWSSSKVIKTVVSPDGLYSARVVNVDEGGLGGFYSLEIKPRAGSNFLVKLLRPDYFQALDYIGDVQWAGQHNLTVSYFDYSNRHPDRSWRDVQIDYHPMKPDTPIK